MKQFFLAVVISLFPLKTYGIELAINNVLFVVDISGSMLGQLPSVKAAITKMVSEPKYQSLNSGLIAFEGCGPQYVKYLVPLAPNNGQTIAQATQNLAAGGGTDIVAALRKAQQINITLIEEKAECADVILFTDHFDTCNENSTHVKLLEEIKQQCSQSNAIFRMDVISLGADPGVQLFLEEITEVVGGRVVNVDGLQDMTEGLKELIKDREKSKISTPKVTAKASPKTEKIPPKKVETKKKEAPKKLEQKSKQEEKKSNSGGKT